MSKVSFLAQLDSVIFYLILVSLLLIFYLSAYKQFLSLELADTF